MDAYHQIAQAEAEELDFILKAVLARYATVFPDWELAVFSFCKTEDIRPQIDAMIALLETAKTIADPLSSE